MPKRGSRTTENPISQTRKIASIRQIATQSRCGRAHSADRKNPITGRTMPIASISTIPNRPFATMWPAPARPRPRTPLRSTNRQGAQTAIRRGVRSLSLDLVSHDITRCVSKRSVRNCRLPDPVHSKSTLVDHGSR